MKNKNLPQTLEKYFSEEIFKTTFDNGLTLLAKEDHSAQISSIQVWVKSGSIHENKYLGCGISHYVEHMLFKGTKKRTYSQITEDIQKVGASINAYTSFDRTVYHVDGPSEATEMAFDVLADITFNSLFDPEETQREQSVILREIDIGLDDPDDQLSKALHKTLFQSHPYKYPVIGEHDLFLKLTREDLLNYYKARYTPSNMTVVVAGPIPIAKVIDIVNKYFGSQESKPLEPVFIPEEKPQNSKRTLYKKGDVKLTRGSITYRIPNFSHPDSPGLGVLANLLGQGTSSHLWQTLREEQKLVDSIYTSLWNPGSTGLFFISYSCDPEKRKAVESAIQRELDNFLKKTIPQKKLDKVITQTMVGEISRYQTMAGKASKIAYSDVIIGDLNYPKTYIRLLQEVTPHFLKELQKKYLIEKTVTVAALEPQSTKETKTTTKEKAVTLPNFKEVKLKNGIRIIMQASKHFPKISARIILPGGPNFEDEKKRGINGVLATLLTKDTKKRTNLEIAEALEEVGGMFFEFSGNNTFGLGIEVMSTDWDLASDILKEAIITPKFTQSNLDIERKAQISSIKIMLDDITSHGMHLLREKFFDKHPYRNDSYGSIKSLESLKLKDIETFYHQMLNPEKMIVSVVGDFDPKKVLKSLTPWLEKIKKIKQEDRWETPFKGPKAADYMKHWKKEQVVVFQAYPTVGAKSTELESAEIIDELLNNMASQLFRKVREEQGLAYFVGASRVIGAKTGMFVVLAGTNQKNYKTVFKEIETEINRIRSGKITKEELIRSKTRLKASQRMSLQTLGSRNSLAAFDAIYDFPINRWRTYDKRIDKITVKDIQSFAKKYFTDDKRVTLAIGNVK